jgi:hypothetical protein
MATIQPALLEKLQQLSPQRLAEVEDFIEFLAAREARKEAADRLGEALARLDTSGLRPVSDEEIDAEIEAARRERRMSRL